MKMFLIDEQYFYHHQKAKPRVKTTEILSNNPHTEFGFNGGRHSFRSNKVVNDKVLRMETNEEIQSAYALEYMLKPVFLLICHGILLSVGVYLSVWCLDCQNADIESPTIVC